MTIAIKTLRKAITLHDAVSKVLDKLVGRLQISRAAYRDKLQAKVKTLVDAEYALQSKVISEPFELRDSILAELDDLRAYFKTESDALLAALRDVDSEANVAERAARQESINKRIAELRKLVV